MKRKRQAVKLQSKTQADPLRIERKRSESNKGWLGSKGWQDINNMHLQKATKLVEEATAAGDLAALSRAKDNLRYSID